MCVRGGEIKFVVGELGWNVRKEAQLWGWLVELVRLVGLVKLVGLGELGGFVGWLYELGGLVG